MHVYVIWQSDPKVDLNVQEPRRALLLLKNSNNAGRLAFSDAVMMVHN
jgi:hypothetical protein